MIFDFCYTALIIFQRIHKVDFLNLISSYRKRILYAVQFASRYLIKLYRVLDYEHIETDAPGTLTNANLSRNFSAFSLSRNRRLNGLVILTAMRPTHSLRRRGA
jgi:hypothetical protein